MIKKRYDLWQEDEYTYPQSFGFQPNLVSYIHEEGEASRPCVIVVPGGGYTVVSPTEGEIVAEEFFRRGYQAFVCTYTVNAAGTAPLKDQPMRDLARAVRYVRKHAGEFGADAEKIVVCGFSAGGHLCGSVCVHYEDIREKNPEYVGLSARPNAAILSYPVITSGRFAHEDSFRKLLGVDASPKELEYYSLEKQVTEKTPPCFLWQTATDELVPVENSCLMAEALRKNGIPFAIHIFSRGAHGLSLANETWAQGKFGEPYPMEQTFNLVKLVKQGQFSCSDEEKQQLLAAFDHSDPGETVWVPNVPNREVSIWPELANQWLKETLCIENVLK